MPAVATNKTNVAALKVGISLMRSNAMLGTGTSGQEMLKLCKELEKTIAWYEKAIQGLA